jgi:hypothetical protein
MQGKEYEGELQELFFAKKSLELFCTPAVQAPTFFCSKKSRQKYRRCKIIAELAALTTEIIELALP